MPIDKEKKKYLKAKEKVQQIFQCYDSVENLLSQRSIFRANNDQSLKKYDNAYRKFIRLSKFIEEYEATEEENNHQLMQCANCRRCQSNELIEKFGSRYEIKFYERSSSEIKVRRKFKFVKSTFYVMNAIII